jgi:ABC-type oligopeptide transport system ATPase subunit
MKVINLFGGPGVGKSTTAAALFVLMKQAGHKVELVTEFAKTLTYEENRVTLDNQLALLGEQDRKLRRLSGKVDYAITDSPLLLSLVYARGEFRRGWFTDAVRGAFDSYNNVQIFLKRKKAYQTYGRWQTEEEARELDKEIAAMLFREHVIEDCVVVDGDEDAAFTIYNEVLKLGEQPAPLG